jgi:linoleoyl-CoA desaturase
MRMTSELAVATEHTLNESLARALAPAPAAVRAARRRLHRDALVTVLLFAVSYGVLVVSSASIPVRIAAAGVLVLSVVATATGIMHDANHGSFAERRWANRLLSYTSDLLGASSWLWRVQHNVLHHGNTNVAGFDADIELAPWARLAPTQPWRRRFRFQHIYIWPLYGFLAIKNLLFSDVLSLLHGRIGHQPLRGRPTRRQVAEVVIGKFAHLGWAVVVPLLFNPWQGVVVFYAACSFSVGFLLAMIFQLAHCVDVAELTGPSAARRGESFAVHQLRTTVDIESPVPVLGHVFRWLAGGLDHQIEHHLAPRLPHTIYARLTPGVRAACDANGVRCRVHPSVSAAVRSHARWLREMGRPPIVTADR